MKDFNQYETDVYEKLRTDITNAVKHATFLSRQLEVPPQTFLVIVLMALMEYAGRVQAGILAGVTGTKRDEMKAALNGITGAVTQYAEDLVPELHKEVDRLKKEQLQ
jgi:hypothetical protein